VLSGILNGADYTVWDPETDPHLPSPCRPREAGSKAALKAALRTELGLAQTEGAPLLVVVSRLTEQKGMDLLLSVLPSILSLGGQLALLGAGDRALEEAFVAAAQSHPDQVAVHIGYSEPLAHRLMAGGDMLLVPSRFEPCGLTQLYAFRYGTVPVGHATGGLADTLVDTGYDTLMTGTANAFVFEHSNAGAFQWAVERAIGLYGDPEKWQRVVAAGLTQDFGWDRSAARYLDLYAEVIGARE
jgi:starch synthase